MQIDQKGIDFIIANEGIRYTAYLDTVGVWTIGVGHTRGVYQGMTITHQQAIDFLYEDIKSHQNFVTFFQRSFNQNQFNALSSFEFNVGGGVWLNDGWNPKASDSEIAYMLSLYKRPVEITARRNREIALFNTPVSNSNNNGNNSNNNNKPQPTIKEMKEMEFIYSFNGATWYYDGSGHLFQFSAPYQLQHITGTYKQLNKKDMPSLGLTKEQHQIWVDMYGYKTLPKR